MAERIPVVLRASFAVLVAVVAASSSCRAEDVPAQAPAVVEQAAVARVDWATLKPGEQRALTPLQGQWSQLAPRQQQRFLRIAARWQGASATQRGVLDQRIARWAAMTPAERIELGARFEKFRALPNDRQQELRDASQRFRDLPPDQRQSLRQRYEQMTPAERDAFVSGADAAKRNQDWQHLVGDAPESERAATRSMWLSLDVPQRRALRKYLRPLPAEDRNALRKRMLAMTPVERSNFIAQLPAAAAVK